MQLVVKDNALINASYTLSLVEQRIVLLAIIEARETQKGIDTETFLEIHAQHYADRFDISVKNAYAMLSEASQALFNRQVTFMMIDEKRNKPEKRVVRWVSGVSYVDGSGIIKLRFAPEIIPLITQLEKNFTSYELSQVASLGLYATRLYELLIAWRSTGKVPEISLDDFRDKMGLASNEYKLMHNFKNRVLEPAIKQINEHTDIKATYEQHKQGRTITGFSFKFKQKSQPKIEVKRDPNTPDFFIKMTDAQRHLFANKMSEMPEMSTYSHGTESYQQFAIRIADMLLEPEKFRELYPCLEKAGFTLNK
ncbi:MULTISPECIES: replication initiation protein RepM [Acinetobacter]|jgi:plasmid replication initiation protein|nr:MULTISPECIES: replication initiation protein RepM [Acinetobacter calcoaceticus/baumannii complex]MBJ9720112.1 replication initiation protein [Acinetobacter pittii]MBJ9778529.1 replication initiation protein [Acinetobacter pittii]PPC52898.1 RepB family plasmid replication initiator protein [Acinetobacter baumannii]WPP82940.1 replication initiation protein RepM [Acinetobacter pittii]